MLVTEVRKIHLLTQMKNQYSPSDLSWKEDMACRILTVNFCAEKKNRFWLKVTQ